MGSVIFLLFIGFIIKCIIECKKARIGEWEEGYKHLKEVEKDWDDVREGRKSAVEVNMKYQK